MKHNAPEFSAEKLFAFTAKGRPAQFLRARSPRELAAGLAHQGIEPEVTRHVTPLAWHRHMELVDRDWRLTYQGDFRFTPVQEVNMEPKQRQSRQKDQTGTSTSLQIQQTQDNSRSTEPQVEEGNRSLTLPGLFEAQAEWSGSGEPE